MKTNLIMKAATKLDKQISDYLIQLSPRQKKAVLTVVETFVKEQGNDDIWEDKAFIAELDRRTAEYERGKAKALTLDQLEARVRAAYKAKQGK